MQKTKIGIHIVGNITPDDDYTHERKTDVA